MLYQKNVPTWERWLRIVGGAALVGYTAVGHLPLLGTAIIVLTATFLVVTAFVGFCPACFLVGRRLKKRQS